MKALIYNSNYQVLLQQRDYTLGIAFPGHWTYFGGQVEEGEDLKEALSRELYEELNWEPNLIEDEIFSWYWESPIKHHNHCFPVYCEAEINDFTLNEGNALAWFFLSELNHVEKVVPGLENNIHKIRKFFQSKVA